LERHPSTVGAEFRTQRLRQSVHDSVRFHTAARPDLVDQRIAVDQSTRKPRNVWYFFVELHDSDVDVTESGIDQRFLDGIDPVIGERYVVKLRRIGREEAGSDFMRDSAERIVLVRVPNAEQVMSAGGQHAMNLAISRLFLREKHHAELAYDSVESAL
jgi:hypothetical protein